MVYRSVVLLAVLAFSVSAQAQKLYKIVDEDGNVTFSQYPPQEKQENATIDEHQVSGGAQSIVEEKRDGLYCGDIQLTYSRSSDSNSRNYIEKLESKRERWLDQRDSLAERIDESNQNKIKQNQYRSSYGYSSSSSSSKYYQESIERNSARMRDLRCALDWVGDELSGSSEIAAQSKQERMRLEGIRNELQTRLDRRCGELPEYDPSVSYNSAARKNWYDCSASLRKEIKRLDRAIDDA